ncbi:MAG: HD domain-containing protein [Candidatus Moranbacteria bacterium]|nr:HD domain-containing protein [Candidatus Moranbacteria bacterium]
MNKAEIIFKTIDFVKETLAEVEDVHGWYHTERVYKLSKKIAEAEKADMFVVELGALLHDIADYKFNDGDEKAGSRKSGEFLSSLGVGKEIIEYVGEIVDNVSFKGGNFTQSFKSLELDVVQDADRLDALGAIGIARAFAYGGYKKQEIHNPEIEPRLGMRKEEYKNNNSPSINHFYEKVLLLKDRMNTKTGKSLAESRHKFVEDYLEEFFKEWDGEA